LAGPPCLLGVRLPRLERLALVRGLPGPWPLFGVGLARPLLLAGVLLAGVLIWVGLAGLWRAGLARPRLLAGVLLAGVRLAGLLLARVQMAGLLRPGLARQRWLSGVVAWVSCLVGR
jgi:hypothetical protein